MAEASLRTMLAAMGADLVIELPDEAATAALGGALARSLAPGEVLALDGPLGAGKTTVVRALVATLGGDPAAVSSPTYTLLHRYPARVPVVHIDAYRLRGPEDLAGLGFEELSEGAIAAIEWAERVRAALPAETLWSLALEHAGAGRRARLTAPGAKRLEGIDVTGKLS
jgi:tRNA threonylcarbamoyl adenosine modification protein YjeE